MSAYPNQFQYRYMHTWLYQHKGILRNKLHSTQDVTEFLFKYSSSSVLLSKRSKSLRTKSNFSLYKTKKQYGYTFFLTSKLLGFFLSLLNLQLYPMFNYFLLLFDDFKLLGVIWDSSLGTNTPNSWRHSGVQGTDTTSSPSTVKTFSFSYFLLRWFIRTYL